MAAIPKIGNKNNYNYNLSKIKVMFIINNQKSNIHSQYLQAPIDLEGGMWGNNQVLDRQSG